MHSNQWQVINEDSQGVKWNPYPRLSSLSCIELETCLFRRQLWGSKLLFRGPSLCSNVPVLFFTEGYSSSSLLSEWLVLLLQKIWAEAKAKYPVSLHILATVSSNHFSSQTCSLSFFPCSVTNVLYCIYFFYYLLKHFQECSCAGSGSCKDRWSNTGLGRWD